MNNPNYGIIVGRFQVNDLHDGHMELFRIVRSRHNRVLVFIGTSPTGLSRNNPLDYETRRRMIQAKFPDISTAPLPDQESDELWSGNLDNEIRKHLSADFGDITLYGGRDSFVPHYHGRYKPVELPIEGKSSGTEIRDRITNTVMESSDFRSGIIYAVNNIRPRVVACVDVIITRESSHPLRPGIINKSFLMAQKPGEIGWRFVGGHAEVTSPDFESDAKREAYEETGCDINSLKYIGSALIDDWRWRKDPDKIKTLVYLGWTSAAHAKAHDDVSSVQWFEVFPPIVPSHRPIYELLKKHLESTHAHAAKS
jgi:bifunctional NMN adenylyltransferase/nudix hydrolase